MTCGNTNPSLEEILFNKKGFDALHRTPFCLPGYPINPDDRMKYITIKFNELRAVSTQTDNLDVIPELNKVLWAVDLDLYVPD